MVSLSIRSKKWLNVDWVKNIDFTPTRTYFASSFSKKLNSKDMENEYGAYIFGYKNDKIAERKGRFLCSA